MIKKDITFFLFLIICAQTHQIPSSIVNWQSAPTFIVTDKCIRPTIEITAEQKIESQEASAPITKMKPLQFEIKIDPAGKQTISAMGKK